MASTALAIAKATDHQSEDDDRVTWDLMVSPTPVGDDVATRLESLPRRFVDDVENPSDADYWQDLCRRGESKGFTMSNSEFLRLPSLTSARSEEIPALFKSEIGKKHAMATASLLDVPEAVAAKLTMRALRSLPGDDSSYKKLIGTRELVMKTLNLHFEQRISRLSVITECLRLEQDEDSLARDSVLSLLDSLDSTYQDGGVHRGLFRRLLTMACKPETRFTREQLQPSQGLRPVIPSSLHESLTNQAGESSWSQFVIDCNDIKRAHTMRERTEAMEALLILLYFRIKGGVRRSDYAFLLIAFRSSSSFFTACAGGRRLSQLAGLICAECTSLWRAFEPKEENEIWLASHPLLYGIVPNANVDRAMTEIESLRNLLYECVAKIVERNEKQLGLQPVRAGNRELQMEVPEALALLSFGLLLSLAHRALSSSRSGYPEESYWDALEDNGRTMIQIANDEFEAFNYLLSVVECLSAEESEARVPKVDVTPFDWQLSDRVGNRFLLENASSHEVAGPNLAYASIAREILEASMSAFDDILCLKNETATENLGMLANLASAIFRNSPTLCGRFWDEWHGYTSGQIHIAPSPLCRFMESAYSLAESAMRDACKDGTFLSLVAPLLCILGSLCFDSHAVENVIPALPPGLVRKALLYCSSPSQPFHNSSLVVLQSISVLTRIGNSRSCREQLRVSLEEPLSSHFDGPRLLSRIINESDDVEIVRCGMEIMAHLLEKAPRGWSIQLGQTLMRLPDSRKGLARFLAHQNSATQAAASVFSGLVDQMGVIVFSESINAAIFLRFMGEGALAAGTALASSCSLVRRDFPTSTSLAYTIMQMYSNMLRSIRVVIEVHKNPDVRSCAIEVRDSMVSFLASSAGLGEAIAYYAIAPISLSLALKMQRFFEDESVVRSVSSSSDGDANINNKYGPWLAATSKKRELSDDDLATAARDLLVDLASTTESLELDLRGCHERGWIHGGDESVLLRTSSSAVRLLAIWASHAEDIGSKRNRGDRLDFDETEKKWPVPLSPQRLLWSVAVSPSPIRTNGTLASAWASAGLSNFELMLQFGSIDKDDDMRDDIPAAAVMDLLHACIFHLQCVILSDEAVDAQRFRTFHRSPKLPKLLIDSASRASGLSASESLEQQEKQTMLRGLLGLRVLAIAIKTNPSYVEEILSLDQSKVANALVQPISKARRMLQSVIADPTSRLLQDEASIMQLRLTGGCLNVIHAMWITKYTSANQPNQSCRSRLAQFLDFDYTVLRDLLLLVTEHASAANLVRQSKSKALGGSSALMTLLASALDILTAEMSAVSEDCNNNVASLKAFKEALGENQSRLVVMARNYATFDSFSTIVNLTSDLRHFLGKFRSGGSFTAPVSLLTSLPSTSSRILSTDFYVLQNSFDIHNVARWVTTFEGLEDLEDPNDVVAAWALSHQLARCELQLLSSWKRFAETLPFFLKKSLTPLVDSSKELLSPRTIFVLLRETLDALNKNAESVNVGQLEVSREFLFEESQAMTDSLSRLLLFFSELISAADKRNTPVWDVNELLETLSLLIEASEKLFTIGLPVWQSEKSILVSGRRIFACKFGLKMSTNFVCLPTKNQSFAALQQQILASAISLVLAIESAVSGSKKIIRRRRDDLYNGVVSIIGKVLLVLASLPSTSSTSVQQQSMNEPNTRLQMESFLTCSSLLTVLVGRSPHSNSSDEFHAYIMMVSNTFREHNVLESLLGHGVMASKAVASSMSEVTPFKETDSEHAAYISIVMSVLTLLEAIANVGNPQMLSLLETSGFVQLVVNNPLFTTSICPVAASSANPRRGYVPSGDHGNTMQEEGSGSVSAIASYSGRDDPIHDVWLTSMMVLKATLRSSTLLQTPQLAERLKDHFFKVSTQFLGSHREKILGCLEECSTASNGSKTSFFTLNLLREASSLLSLVSELCSRETRDKFCAENRSLFDELVSWSKFVVVSISKFLGASGTSRELFLALSEYDTADALGGTEYHATRKLRHPAFAGGVPNAKHEATRYSHFASGFCACVTRNDFEAASTVPSHLKHLSQDKAHDSVLERNCRRSVTSVFVLRLERAAADVLSQAVSVIWSTHPAASCFVMLSEREASMIDTMPNVNSGMIIAFRPARKRRFSVPSGREVGDSIMFGKVLSSNTINRSWDVQVIDEQENQVTVPAWQLAGMEDMSKRKCVGGYRPAADSATDLESMEGTLTLGHLILALRWCHQNLTTTPRDGKGTVLDAFVQRLAEQVSALLGSEVSLHEVVGSRKHMSKADETKLDAQILELFGDDSAQSGRLTNLLSDSAWRAIRPQIKREIERARAEIEENERKRREGRSPHASDGMWYRRAHNSPFRGLL